MASKDEIMDDLDNLVKPIIEYIKKTWNTENLLPFNYKEYLEQLKTDPNQCDMFVNESKKLTNSYTGLVNEKPGYADCPLHRLISPHYVTYGKFDQGNDPLDTLIIALICWGMDLQTNREKFISGKDEEDKETAKEKKELELIALNEIKKINDVVNEEMQQKLAKIAIIIGLMKSTKIQNLSQLLK